MASVGLLEAMVRKVGILREASSACVGPEMTQMSLRFTFKVFSRKTLTLVRRLGSTPLMAEIIFLPL